MNVITLQRPDSKPIIEWDPKDDEETRAAVDQVQEWLRNGMMAYRHDDAMGRGASQINTLEREHERVTVMSPRAGG